MTDYDGGPHQPSPLRRLGSTAPRRLVVIVLLVAGTYLLIPRLAGVADTLKLMRQADGRYLLLALACQISTVVLTACVVYGALPAFGPRIRFPRVLEIALASTFASMFIPSAGLSGLALRARYFGEAGCSVEAVLLTYVVETLGQGMAITIMVALALLWLTVAGQGAPWWILALLLGTILAGSTFLAILVSRPHEADWRLALLDRVIKMLPQQGRRALQALALEERLGNLRQAVLALSTALRLRLLLASIGRVLADILCLQLTLLAFGQAVLLGWTTIGYGLSAVLSYLSSLPGGLFVTEGSLSAILATQGVPLALAVAAILTYRLFAFWLPRVLGLGTWWNLQRRSDLPLW